MCVVETKTNLSLIERNRGMFGPTNNVNVVLFLLTIFGKCESLFIEPAMHSFLFYSLLNLFPSTNLEYCYQPPEFVWSKRGQNTQTEIT